MAELASFWVGGPLGPIEIASIKSFLRHGDNITVFSPHPLELPEGARWADANEIYPSETIIRHRKTGSAALHSDLFRYALMAKTDMIWVDLDVIALRSLEFDSDWVFAWESSDWVAMGILKLPKDSPTLKQLLEIRPGVRGLPEYFTWHRRLKYKIRTFGRGMTIEGWPWGATGPRTLTHILRQTGEIRFALPQSAFYSIEYEEATRFLTPGALRLHDLPDDAWAVHLWAKVLRTIIANDHNGRVPEGSFLDLALRGEL